MSDLDTNRRTVLAFHEHALRRRDFTTAAQYLARVPVQHRSDAADGADGLREVIDQMRVAYPQAAA